MTHYSSTPESSQSAGHMSLATTSLGSLKMGVTLRLPLYSDHGLLLVAQGATITPQLIEQLRQRGVMSIHTDEKELARLTGRVQPGAQPARAPTRSVGGLGPRTLAPKVEWSPSQMRATTAQRQAAVQEVQRLYHPTQRVTREELTDFHNLARTSITTLEQDIDLFVTSGLVPPGFGRYPVTHSVNFAMLALSVGANLSLSLLELKQLAVGCLVHDLGLLQLNLKLLQEAGSQGAEARLELSRHPTITYELLKDVESLAKSSRIVALEVHERMDGSGYPRRRSGNQIHFLSRIAAVAEHYAALTAVRSHREPLTPYQALTELLNETRVGKFDKQVVQALLRVLSLFPIGSYVALTDGRVGQVLRANGEHYTRPLVSAWRVDAPHEPELVNLVDEEQLEIQQSLASLPVPTPVPAEQ